MRSYTIQFPIKIQTITFFKHSSKYQQRKKQSNPSYRKWHDFDYFFSLKKVEAPSLFFFRFHTIYFFHSLSSKFILQLVEKQKVLIFATFLFFGLSSKSQGSTERFFSDKYQIPDHTPFVFAIIISTRLANFVLHLDRWDETLERRMKNGKEKIKSENFLFLLQNLQKVHERYLEYKLMKVYSTMNLWKVYFILSNNSLPTWFFELLIQYNQTFPRRENLLKFVHF